MGYEPNIVSDDVIKCWCGAVGTYDDLFADDFGSWNCGGSGFLQCECGGDFCVCHHHGGEVECPGCEECGYGELDGDEDRFWDSEEDW